MARRRPRLVIAVTDPMSAILVRGQLGHAQQHGFDVTFISGPGEIARSVAAEEGVQHIAIPMKRGISPTDDFASLTRLARTLRAIRPDVVNAGTPKAGLLVTTAAAMTGVQVRIYTLRGLRSEGLNGLKGGVVRGLEKTSCGLAHRVVCISASLRERAVELGIVSRERSTVLLSGSSNGIDVARFSRTPELNERARELRSSLGIDKPDVVLGFVGRIVADKGVGELATAWASLRVRHPKLHFLLIGPTETDNAIPPAVLSALREDPRVHMIGKVHDPRPYYAAMDVFAMPSYREGFGNVLIEAAAFELPVVSTRVPGCVDAVADGVTGTLVPPKDAGAVAEAIDQYIRRPDLRDRHAQAGRARVLREFRRERIWDALLAEYWRLLRGGSQHSESFACKWL